MAKDTGETEKRTTARTRKAPARRNSTRLAGRIVRVSLPPELEEAIARFKGRGSEQDAIRRLLASGLHAETILEEARRVAEETNQSKADVLGEVVRILAEVRSQNRESNQAVIGMANAVQDGITGLLPALADHSRAVRGQKS